MGTETETVIKGLQALIAEEMHLLGEELQDSLDTGQSRRLTEIAKALDHAAELLASHQAARADGRAVGGP